MRGGSHARPFVLDLAASAEAGIDEAALSQRFERGVVGRVPRALAERVAVPFQAEPFEVLLDPLIELLAHAGGVDVFMAQ